MANEFKLPGSSYEELTQIIKAYGHLAKPANLEEVRSASGVSETQVSRNAAFLINVGVIDGGKAKQITQQGKDLANALENDYDEAISRAWRRIVLENDFLSRILNAIKVRNGMDISTYQSHIAYSAGQKATGFAKRGAATVLQIFLNSNLVESKDDTIKTLPIPIDDENDVAKGSLDGEVRFENSKTDVLAKQRVVNSSGLNVSLELQIKATPSDLDGLAERLATFIHELRDHLSDD